MLCEYLLKYHEEDLHRILDAAESQIHYSIRVNFVSLFDADCNAAENILNRPRHFLPLCDKSAIKAQEQIAKPEQTVKEKVRIRIVGVPNHIDVQCGTIDGQFGQLVSISGTTVRTSQPTVLVLTKRYNCNKCKHITVVQLEWERRIFNEVRECNACHSRSITALTSVDREDCSDYQEIKISSNKFYTEGLLVTLLDDLVDKCRPGDSVDISGVLIRRWGPLIPGRRAEAIPIMLANSVSIRNKIFGSLFSTEDMKDIFLKYWERYTDNPLAGRDNILASLCPQMYGMYPVKLALAVVLAGGVSKCNEAGTRVRGEPHLLLIGDPGTGKSQLLRVASRLAVRSVLTTGIGSTAAGLTAAAVKDTDGWHLEGGALVQADGGVCCVDEFATMSSQDRASIHEAMEQQTISIAKAGMVTTLNSRCTVIAAINPSGGRFTEGEDWKTRLGDPLLSRFDLILLLKDKRNAEWDRMTSAHILKAACDADERTVETDSKKSMDLLKSEALWKDDTLREYLAHVHSLRPVLTKEAEAVLRATYLYHRSNPHRRAERTTVRLLDSLVRLAEGHARLMYKSEVELIDAIQAAELIGTGTTFEIDLGCSFPKDPKAEYQLKGRKLLTTLGLQNLEHLL